MNEDARVEAAWNSIVGKKERSGLGSHQGLSAITVRKPDIAAALAAADAVPGFVVVSADDLRDVLALVVRLDDESGTARGRLRALVEPSR
jgi:hypothetical protein